MTVEVSLRGEQKLEKGNCKVTPTIVSLSTSKSFLST